MDPDPQESQETKKGLGLSTLALWLLGLLAAYVLSTGPAILFAKRYPSARRSVTAIYQPLLTVFNHSPDPIGKAYYFYLHNIWHAM